ncbi:hypothetical protein [Paraburkholderia sediminicola]|uniref:hypothetical protein n=1 Tax=Paraburkholderia sediminicola TaxID=458836 RepID=UPI0038BD8696
MKHFKRLIAVAILVLASFSSTQAFACCGDGPIAAAGAMQAGASVVASISTATGTIVSWLQQINNTIGTGFANLYSEIAKQSAEQRLFAQGTIASQTQLYMEKARGDAETKYELSPRACFEVAGGTSGSVGADQVKQGVSDLNQQFAQRTLYTPNTTAAVAQIFNTHTSNYCSAQDVQLGRCSSAATADLQNADVRADSLFNASSLDTNHFAAAQALVSNIANPIPTQNIPKGWEQTPQGKAFVAGQYIEQSRSSVAANSLNNAIAMRVPVPGLGTAAMVNKADISQMELIESQVNGRFTSPQWYQMIAGFSSENLLREMNKQMALKLYMELASYHQFERIETVLATQLAMDVQTTSDAQLREARAAAARAGR